MIKNKTPWIAVFTALMVVAPLFVSSGTVSAQGGSRTFQETGKTVKGKFLAYWESHGGLPQQGFPISEEMQEKSDTDGKTYTVQYFERAVFEMHPEKAAPNDVLLSLLGNFLYKQKYASGTPNQKPNTTAGSQMFKETDKRVGGKFLAYWQKNGGLAQQGFPISEEFTERNELDGKTYTVQYFERAVFEMHTENKAPFDVLLSQLGTFRYKAKYAAAKEAKVDMVDIEFKPKELTVAVGTKVTWTQLEIAPHTVVSKSGPKVLNSPFMDKVGDKYSYTFANPGTYEYWCTVHPEMIAKVIVK